MSPSNDLRLFVGTSVPDLGNAVCEELGISPSRWKLIPEEGSKNWYSNGCFELELKENCRGRHVFIMQTSLPDVYTLHTQLFELFQLVMAAKKAVAGKVTVIMPYFSYARSDKKSGRMPLMAKMIPAFLEALKTDMFFGINFHSDQNELAFNIDTPVDAPTIFPHLIEHLKDLGWKDTDAIVLPGDQGSLEIAKDVGRALHLRVGLVVKDRRSDNEVRIESIEGDLKDRPVLIVDDEICGATTAREVAKESVSRGAKEEITVVTAHALFTGNAIKKLQYPPIKKVIVSDTVPAYQRIDPDSLNLEVVTIAPFLARAVREINKGSGSVSKLYEIPPPEKLVRPVQWELNPAFKEILTLEKKVGEKWLSFFEQVGINSKVMAPEHLPSYRDLLKKIVVS